MEYALENAPDTHVNLLLMRVAGNIGTFLDLCRKYKKVANTIRIRVGGGVSLKDAFLLPDYRRGKIKRLLEAGRANEE